MREFVDFNFYLILKPVSSRWLLIKDVANDGLLILLLSGFHKIKVTNLPTIAVTCGGSFVACEAHGIEAGIEFLLFRCWLKDVIFTTTIAIAIEPIWAAIDD